MKVLFCCVVAASIFSSIIPLHAAQVTLPVQEDSWLSGLGSTSTHGADQTLGICPVANYWIYLKFDLRSVSGTITAAEVRMRRVDGSRPEEISLYLVTDDSWREATLTGPNRPAPTMPANNTALAVGQAQTGYDRWTSAAFANAIEAEKNGDGIVSLMLREDPASVFDIRHYFSKEAPAGQPKPELVLTVAPAETIAAGWRAVEIGAGAEPSFDFDAMDRFHVMALVDGADHQIWYATAPYLEGPWSPAVVAQGHFDGPGDLRCDPNGTAHLVWHNLDSANADHLAIPLGGPLQRYDITSAGLNDGWDNSLAVDSVGRLHLAAIYPADLGAQHSLQRGSFNGTAWLFESAIVGSGLSQEGLGTSIAVDSLGEPHLVFCAGTNWTGPSSLRYAFRQGGVWNVSTVVSNGIRGHFPSLALDHWDRPNIAWLDIDQGDINRGTVRYGVLNGGQWDIEEVGTLENIHLGQDGARKSVSLALDEDWRPHVAYGDRRRVVYAFKPFDVWQTTNVLEHGEATYNGLVVLRLNSEDEPFMCFWQPAAGTAGRVRLAGLRDPNIYLYQPVPNGGSLVLNWTSGAEENVHYIVEKRSSLTSGSWSEASGVTPLTVKTWTDPNPGSSPTYRVRTVP